MAIPRDYIIVDFNSNATRAEHKESHLHKMKPIPDPNGSRAERRAAKKKRGWKNG